MAGPEDPHSGDGLPPATSNAETLSYLCEIIHELRQLAEKGGYWTLAAILSAALIEARIQSDLAER